MDLELYKLTKEQEGLWIDYCINPNSSLYNAYVLFQIKGNLNIERFTKSEYIVISHFDTVGRVRFVVNNDVPNQYLLDKVEYNHFEFIDLSKQKRNNITPESIFAAKSRTPVKLEHEPGIKSYLIKYSDNTYYYGFIQHHILSDAFSADLLCQALSCAYNEDEETLKKKFPQRSLGEYVNYLNNDSKEIEYWKTKLKDVNVKFNFNRNDFNSNSNNRGLVKFRFEDKYLQTIKLTSRNCKTTPYLFLKGVFGILLFKYWQQNNIIINYPFNSRTKDFYKNTGNFVKILPFKLSISNDLSFRELIERMNKDRKGDNKNTNISYLDILDIYSLNKKHNERNANISFAQSRFEINSLELNGCSVKSLDVFGGDSGEDINFLYDPFDSEYKSAIYFNRDLFDEIFINQLIKYYKYLIVAIAENTDGKIEDIENVTDDEKKLVLHTFNNTKVNYPKHKTVIEIFEEQVEKTPEGTAIEFENIKLSYAELNEKSNKVACFLAEKYRIESGDLIGVALARSEMMIISLLGVLKAGGAYVPIDTNYPKDRISYILNDCKCSVLLTQESVKPELPENINTEVFCVDEKSVDVEIEKKSSGNITPTIQPQNLAYILYTSGTTGKPKGVMVENSSLTDYTQTVMDYFKVSCNDIVVQQSSVSFDTMVEEIFPALCSGAMLVILKEGGRDIEGLKRLIYTKKVSLLSTTPLIINELNKEPGSLNSLRVLISGGDMLRPHHIDNLIHRTEIYNTYGPTESTVCATYHKVENIEECALIGKPINNRNVFIMNNSGLLCPIGMPGEIVLGGKGIVRGYLNQDSLTKEKFIPSPFNNGEKLYLTGDIGMWRNDGNIEFLGRVDDQLKIRGYRIEPGEIESAINNLKEINSCIVLAQEDKVGNKRLVAYVTPCELDKSGEQLIKNLRENLAKLLPDYMVPALFVKLDKLPLTPNGKVDKKALPEPETDTAILNEYVAPLTEIEKKLAAIWKELLLIDKVGVNDNFFEFGGDSIISIQVVSRANQQGISLTPKDVFKHQTIKELAKVCSTSKSKVVAEQSLVKGEVGLTPIQSWFFDNNFKNQDHFNQAVTLKVKESIGVEVLEKALNAIIEQHDVLRLCYKNDNNGWIQEHVDISNIKLEVADLSDKSEKELSKAIEEYATNTQASLSIANGPVFKSVLFKTVSKKDNYLLLVIHHLAVDGVSWRILIDDIKKACIQQIENTTINLGAKTSSFKHWSEKLYSYANSDTLMKELPFWTGIIKKATTTLALDNKVSKNMGVSSDNISMRLNRDLTKQLLQEAGKAYNTVINDLLLTALVLTIGNWIKANNITINLEGHGREDLFEDTDVSRTVGWFTSLFPVCLSLDNSLNIGGTIKSIKEQLRAIPRKGIGFGILRYLNPENAIRERLKLAEKQEFWFNYLGQFNDLEADTDLKLISLSNLPSGIPVCVTNFRSNIIEINSIISNGELVLDWAYNKNIYSSKSIENLAAKYISELQKIIEHCVQPQTKGYTPSDFPLCQVSQIELDKYVLAKTSINNIESIYPLSPMQEGMLFHSLYSPNSQMYVTQLSVDFVGDLDSGAFKNAWQQIINKHTILRTSFVSDGVSKPLQRVHKTIECIIEEIDYSNISKDAREEEIAAYIEEDRCKGLDLTLAPLSRFTLIKLSADCHTLIWTHHHILLDGWCLPIIFKELFQNYQALCNNKVLPIKPDKYENFIAYLASKDKTEAELFWKNYLDGFIHPTEIPFGNSFNKLDESDEYGLRNFEISIDETRELNCFAKKHRLTVNTLVQAAWAKLLQTYSGEEDVVFGITVSGRPAELEGVEEKIGLFINTLPLRIKTDKQQAVVRWLETIQEQQPLIREYEHIPLVRIQSLSSVPNNKDLFTSILVFENYPIGDLKEQSHVSLDMENVQSFEKTNYPLTLAATIGESLKLGFLYNKSVYTTETIKRIMGHFKGALINIVENAHEPVASIDILTSEEKHLLLKEWNDTIADYPKDKTIIDLFEEKVDKAPENIALVLGEERISYGQLNNKANSIAYKINRKLLGGNKKVGMLFTPSVEMIASILGILKTGCVYVPLSPNAPVERNSYILRDCEASLLLVQEKLDTHEYIGRLSIKKDQIVTIADKSSIIEVKNNPKRNISPEDLIYVIYTSGTSGNPKGVDVKHKGVVNFISWRISNYNFTPEHVTLQLLSYHFDGYASNLYASLLSGGSLVLIEESTGLNANHIQNVIRSEKVTNSVLTPGIFEVVLSGLSKVDDLLDLRFVVLAGEKANQEIVQKSKNILPHVLLYNEYGPTETSIGATFNKGLDSSNTAIIGKPVSNTSIYILEQNNELLPIGVPGELCISGDGLANGYVNNDALTNEKFVTNPFQQDEKMYKTGDLARFLSDGNIEFLGRSDDQVKIRGFRIELGEIESSINKLEEISTSIVQAKEDKAGNKQLVVFVVASNEAELNIEKIRETLSITLPDYMVPSLFVKMETLPLTSNGKIDKKALPELEGNIIKTNEYVAPETEIEKNLANIWKEVLGIDQVGIYDDFFELGGNSINLIRLQSIANKNSISIPLKLIYNYPDIASLSKQLENYEYKNDDFDVSGLVKLSVGQAWFLGEKIIDDCWVNIQQIEADVMDMERLLKVTNQLIEYHDSVRTKVTRKNKDIKQEILVHNNIEAAYHIDYKNYEFDINKLRPIKDNVVNDMKIDSGLMFRIAVVEFKNVTRILFFFHHLIFDGYSTQIFLNDFFRLYAGEIMLPAKSSSFKNYIQLLHEYINSEEYVNGVEYWSSHPYDEIVKANKRDVIKNKKSEIAYSNIIIDKTFEFKTKKEEIAGKGYQMTDLLAAIFCKAMYEVDSRRWPIIKLLDNGRNLLPNAQDSDFSNTVGYFAFGKTIIIDNKRMNYNDFNAALSDYKTQFNAIPNNGIDFDLICYSDDKFQDSDLLQHLLDIGSGIIVINYLSIPEAEETNFQPKQDEIAESVIKRIGDYEFVRLEITVIEDKNIHISFEYDSMLYSENYIQKLTNTFENYIKLHWAK